MINTEIIFFFIIEELDELVQCKTWKEKESIIQKVENKITEEYGKKIYKEPRKVGWYFSDTWGRN